MAECPICGNAVEYNDVEIGELVSCPDCGSELEVTGVKPLAITEAPEEEEDWGE